MRATRPGVDHHIVLCFRRLIPILAATSCLLPWAVPRLTLADDWGATADAHPVVGIQLPDALPPASSRFPGRYEFAAPPPGARGFDASPDAAGAPPAATGSGSAQLRVTVSVPGERILVVRRGRLVGVHSNTRDPDPTASVYSVHGGSIDGPLRPLTPRLWRAAATTFATHRRVHGWIPAT